MVMQAEAVVTREAEFAGPAWMFGSRSYQVLPDDRSVQQTRVTVWEVVERPATDVHACNPFCILNAWMLWVGRLSLLQQTGSSF